MTNKSQIRRMAELSGAAFPTWLAERVDAATTPDEVRHVGGDAATELCARLLEAGAPGLHFYTLNRAELSYAICHLLGVRAKA